MDEQVVQCAGGGAARPQTLRSTLQWRDRHRDVYTLFVEDLSDAPADAAGDALDLTGVEPAPQDPASNEPKGMLAWT
jgi:hypothetical protein